MWSGAAAVLIALGGLIVITGKEKVSSYDYLPQGGPPQLKLPLCFTSFLSYMNRTYSSIGRQRSHKPSLRTAVQHGYNTVRNSNRALFPGGR